MSREELHNIASHDAPNSISVPNTLAGLVVWAAARWGVAIIFSCVLVIGIKRVYEDLILLNERVLSVIEAQTENSGRNAAALIGLSGEIAKNREILAELRGELPGNRPTTEIPPR